MDPRLFFCWRFAAHVRSFPQQRSVTVYFDPGTAFISGLQIPFVGPVPGRSLPPWWGTACCARPVQILIALWKLNLQQQVNMIPLFRAPWEQQEVSFLSKLKFEIICNRYGLPTYPEILLSQPGLGILPRSSKGRTWTLRSHALPWTRWNY